MSFEEKLEAFRALLEVEQRARLRKEKFPEQLITDKHYGASVKVGRKYANVDFGGSGKYMVELATGNIFGIKGYGVIHRGHAFGTLDTINEFDWSHYSGYRKGAA